MTGVTYDCCQHCSCPETSDGHPTPCRAVPARSHSAAPPTKKAARAMAAADRAKR